MTYVGGGDEARLVKICHNLMLGVVTQSMAEITVLAEAAGVKRADFLDFLNDSVMGSTFTRYKTPAFVNLATPRRSPGTSFARTSSWGSPRGGSSTCRCR